MPNPTIDLQRDCELFVDFDTDYFDSQRDKILDRSGNGRHPEASGGPALGANGPDNFEAASFDGSDDFFETVKPPVGDEITVFSIVRSQDGASSNNTLNVGSSKLSQFPWSFEVISDRVEFAVSDGTDNLNVSISANASGYRFAVGRAKSNDFISVSDKGANKSVRNINIPIAQNPKTLTIGARSDFKGGGSQFQQADIASVAYWSRVLSDAEVEYLFRLTEPRRAQL
jgi:hypothetical protein